MSVTPDEFGTAARPFVKMHGLRNHFVIVDARREPFTPAAEAIVRICDVQTGVGADQLVVIEPGEAADVDAFMRLYNVDGREVEACGNATRCVAWLLLEELKQQSVSIETLAGVLHCRRSGRLRVSCDMGQVRNGWRDIPMAAETETADLNFPALSVAGGIAANIGNPHVVFFVDDLQAVDIETLAPDIQRDPRFPEQVNVGFAQLTGRRSLALRVYERGVGLTMACGSGACVAVWAARETGLIDRAADPGPVDVSLPGGIVSIDIDERDHLIMNGPVAYSFSGSLAFH